MRPGIMISAWHTAPAPHRSRASHGSPASGRDSSSQAPRATQNSKTASFNITGSYYGGIMTPQQVRIGPSSSPPIEPPSQSITSAA